MLLQRPTTFEAWLVHHLAKAALLVRIVIVPLHHLPVSLELHVFALAGCLLLATADSTKRVATWLLVAVLRRVLLLDRFLVVELSRLLTLALPLAH